jgi:hypothetical protein
MSLLGLWRFIRPHLANEGLITVVLLAVATATLIYAIDFIVKKIKNKVP